MQQSWKINQVKNITWVCFFFSIFAVPENLATTTEMTIKSTADVVTAQPTEVSVTEHTLSNESLAALQNWDHILHGVHSMAFRWYDQKIYPIL